MIAMPPAPPVHRACIETGRTTDTFQRIPEILTPQMDAPPVIHQHDMHLLTGTRLFKMTGIRSNRLPRSAPRQQPEEYTQMLPQGDQLFYPHTGYMHIRQMSSHIRIPFIGAYD